MRLPAHLALVAVISLLVTGTAHADTWTDLWSTHEQQAQQLLDSKHPGAAAPLFRDARRRAYAELEAGQYGKAAKSLEPFKDADSQYNRGNALAHAGQLREALTAYDAALAAAPGDKDVIHNRDLVKRALQQQQQNQAGQQGGSNGRSGTQGSQGGQSQGGSHSPGGGQPQAGNQGNQSGGQSQNGSQSPSGNAAQANTQHDGQSPSNGQSQPGSQAGNPSQGAGNQPQPGSASQAANPSQGGSPPQQGNSSQPRNQSQGGAQSGGQSQAGDQPQGANPSRAANSSQAANPSQGRPPSQAGAARPDSGEGGLAPNGQQTNDSAASAGLNAENAKQDAAAALRYRQSQQGRAAPGTSATDTGQASILGGDGKTRSSSDLPAPKPPSEQTLALDQWLRGIPDDSAELLRRKFLIEHMLKQQQSNEP